MGNIHSELADCTNTLLREISDESLNQRQIAMTYALAIRSSEKTDWAKVNTAIIKRWSESGLIRIKKMRRLFTRLSIDSMRQLWPH